MICSIARNCNKLFPFNQITQIKALNQPLFNLSPSIYLFAQTVKPVEPIEPTSQTTTQKPRKRRQKREQQAFSPVDYYRNTIRRVNIKTNGRGHFSSYNLQKIIGLTKNQQHAKIMFEAYYNYLGHFTQIPNTVADLLVNKAIQVGNQVEQVLQIFGNHNYLAYFPHYGTTNRFLKYLMANQDQQALQKMFKILIRSPLIKINAKTVDILTDYFSKEDCQSQSKQFILKILLFRRNLITGINQEDLASKVAKLIEENQVGPFEARPRIREAMTELLASNSVSTEDKVNRLLWSSVYEMIDQGSDLLARQEQQIGAEHERYLAHLQSLFERSSKEKNYGAILKQKLANSNLSINNAEKLERLLNGSQ